MPNLAWAVLCTKGVLDKYTNQVSIHDVIEEITIKTTEGEKGLQNNPVVALIMMLVATWTRTDQRVPERPRMRAHLRTPRDPQPAIPPDVDIDLESGERCRVFIKLEGLAFRGPGIYAFQIQVCDAPGKLWKTVGTASFNLKVEAVPKEESPKESGRTTDRGQKRQSGRRVQRPMPNLF